MEYKYHRDFMPSVRDLYHKGGMFQKAAKQVQAVIGALTILNMDPFSGLRLTKNGESRIKKCLKYDLTGHARLVTIQDSGVTLFCYTGDHSACDVWLDRNRGFTLTADEYSRVDAVLKSSSDENSDVIASGPSALTKGALYSGLPEEYFDRLIDGLPRRIVRKLESMESIHDERNIYDVTQEIPNLEQALAIYDAFVLIRQDKRQDALARVKLFLGETRTIAELTLEELGELADSERIKTLPADDPRFQQVFEHFVKCASYMDWMLFLHPYQQEIVDRDFPGAAKLVGVSGSGKTCIVVKRAVRLAEKYPEGRILVLTLNRQLARLIHDMVDAACIAGLRDRIDVMPLFSLCQDLLRHFEPENEKLYDDITWKSKEHIDEVWREYYRCELNNRDAEVLLPVHDSLIARNVNAEQYIREEFDWIRSAMPSDPASRARYLDIDREGRGYPLDKRFRQVLLDGLRRWEVKMRAIGVTDYLGLSTALCNHIEKIAPSYRCVLVDESQDFGTIEYQLIRNLVKINDNDLFFCGDAAQQVSTKHRSFQGAGINIPPARSLELKKNYRNSREILRAAFDILVNNLSEEMLRATDFEVLDPEFANFSATAPLMLRADTLEEEIAYALAFVSDVVESQEGTKCCVAFCGFSLYEIQQFGKRLGLAVLDGTITIETGSTYLSDLEHTKGFEFDTMIIVNCNDRIIPDPTKPEKEQFRDLSRFYVAMTRAKNQLIVSHSRNQSMLLAKAEANFLQDAWTNHVGKPTIEICGVPPSLDEIRHAGEPEAETVDSLDLSGPEFLYTPNALGLSNLLIEKLRSVVSGRSVVRGGVPIEWPTLRKAKTDTDHSPRSRQAFGREGIMQFRGLLDYLSQSFEDARKNVSGKQPLDRG